MKVINNETSQNVRPDLQKILALWVIDYFVHNIAFIAQSKKIFRPQSSDDKTLLSAKTDYVWDPDWSHLSFINIKTGISSVAITTISVNREYVKLTPLTNDATTINYNTIFNDRKGNNSPNSTQSRNI